MTKKIFVAIAIAVALPAAAHAQTKNTKAKEKKDENKETLTINTSPGSEKPPTTDITDLSTKNRRDFVADPTGVSFGATLGLGTQDTYGFGVGAKAGYTLPNRLYFGGVGAYHIGNQTEALGNTITNKTWFVGPEAGYDIGVSKVILRPALGIGLAFRNQTANGTGLANAGNQTDTRLYIAPGASIIAPIGNFFVGGDARVMFTTKETNLGVYAVGGAHL